MNLALWIIAGLLAVVFLAGGAMKVVRTKQQLVAAGLGFVDDLSAGTVKAIGTLEMLAAVGLTLPAVTGIAPVLVPVAAAGLMALMIGAMITHLRRGEPHAIAVNLTFCALAAVVAWGRFGPHAFTAGQ